MSVQAQDCIDIEQIKTDLSNIVDKCSCEDPLVLGVPNQTTFISSYQLGIVIQNECIEVYGTLILDQTTSFRHCDFIMDDGALIEINAGLVSFIECNLQSCGDYFWDGIWVETSRTLVFRGNTMQHAFRGIYAKNASVTCYVEGNVFNNNRHSINLEDKNFQQLWRSSLTLNGNIFGKTDDLKLHWEEAPSWSHEVSYGVQTNYAIVNALVGDDPCERTNIFVGLHDGYYLENTVSQIHANLFHDFEPIDGNSRSGSGITSQAIRNEDIGRSSTTIKGWPTNDIATFKNIPSSGIWAGVGSVDIQSCIIENTIVGISNPVPYFRNWIKGNNIAAQKTGVHGMRISNTNSIISNNSINIINRGATASFFADNISGILIWSEFDGGRQVQIFKNLINLNSGYSGIYTLGSRNKHFNISCNNINIHELVDGNSTGIRILGGNQNRLVENAVHGQYSTPAAGIDEVNGIKIIESQGNLLKNNYVNKTQIGLHFSNWNSNTMQEKNSMANHDIGYFIGENSVTGDQFFAGNKWLGSYSDWAALNDGEPEFSRYHDHQNFVGTSCWPSIISPMGGWFIPHQSLGTCLSLTLETNCIMAEPDRPVISELGYLDSLVARGELDFESFPDRRTWQAQRYLLKTLMDFPDLVEYSGSLMDSFLNEIHNSSVWEYYEMRNLIEEYSTMPYQLEDLWNSYYGDYEDLIDDAEVAIGNWLEHPDSLELTIVITDIYEEIDSIWALSAAAVQSWKVNSMNNLNGLLPQIANLSTPNLYAASEKLIMVATIKMAESTDSLGESLVDDLVSLAESCLLEYGPSVIDARGIVKFLDHNIAPIELNCSQGSELRRVNPSVITGSDFELYPNPNTGSFNLKFESEIIDNGLLEIYDNVGRLVFSKYISTSSGIVQVSVDHLPPGQYNLKVIVDDKKEVQSLIINR